MTIFVSNVPQDDELARKLAKSLTDRGFSVWLDREKIYPGDNWSVIRGQALEQADVMVIVITAAYLKSEWALNDLAFGFARFPHRLFPVFSPELGDLRRVHLPAGLSLIGGIDLKTVELDAAAARIASSLREPVVAASSGLRPVAKKRRPAAQKKNAVALLAGKATRGPVSVKLQPGRE